MVHKILSFFHEDEGQATTEYILLISIVVGMLVLVIKKLIGPAFSKLSAALSNAIENRLFKGDLHTFRIGR